MFLKKQYHFDRSFAWTESPVPLLSPCALTRWWRGKKILPGRSKSRRGVRITSAPPIRPLGHVGGPRAWYHSSAGAPGLFEDEVVQMVVSLRCMAGTSAPSPSPDSRQVPSSKYLGHSRPQGCPAGSRSRLDCSDLQKRLSRVHHGFTWLMSFNDEAQTCREYVYPASIKVYQCFATVCHEEGQHCNIATLQHCNIATLQHCV